MPKQVPRYETCQLCDEIFITKDENDFLCSECDELMSAAYESQQTSTYTSMDYLLEQELKIIKEECYDGDTEEE